VTSEPWEFFTRCLLKTVKMVCGWEQLMSVRRAKGMTSLDFHDMYITDLQTHGKSSLFGKCGVLESISWSS